MPTHIKLEFDRFIKAHFAIPFLSFLMLLSGLAFTRLDLWISRHFYNAELQQWTYKENLLAETVLHVGGQYFTYLAAAMLICLLASLRVNSAFHRYHRELAFLSVASIIALLKSSTHIYWPRDLALFGGDKSAFIRFRPQPFENRPLLSGCSCGARLHFHQPVFFPDSS